MFSVTLGLHLGKKILYCNSYSSSHNHGSGKWVSKAAIFHFQDCWKMYKLYIPRTFLSFVFRGRFKSIATCWKDCLLGGGTVFWKRPVFLHLNLHMRVPYYMESSHHIGSIGIVPLDSSFMELHSLPPI